MFFRIEKPYNLYVNVPEKKSFNVVYYIKKLSKYYKNLKILNSSLETCYVKIQLGALFPPSHNRKLK